MRERAKLIGGTLVVRSEVDVRTEVELRLPAVRAYTAPRRGAWFARTFAGKAKD